MLHGAQKHSMLWKGQPEVSPLTCLSPDREWVEGCEHSSSPAVLGTAVLRAAGALPSRRLSVEEWTE